MKKIFLVRAILLLAGIVVLTLILSCSGPSLETILDNESVQPDDVLTEIPIYPEAEVSTAEELEFEPFSTPRALNPAIRPFDVVYETVSVRYAVQEETEKILNWYQGKLRGKGYQPYTKMTYNGPGRYEANSMGFYRPEYPLISVEIHVYAVPDTTVFALIVSRDTTTSLQPSEPPLPDDIVRMDISYTGDQDNTSLKTETFTDAGDFRRLVDIANNLSLYAYGPPSAIGPPTFTIVFHSLSTGDIPLKYNIGFDIYAAVRINNSEYRDTDGKLLKAVKRILDI